MLRIIPLTLSTCVIVGAAGIATADPQVDRGKYLVTIMGCNDCHTPGGQFNPDPKRMLSGPDFGFGIPGLGVVVARNLTPDMETGLGAWTADQIVTAVTTGVRPDGRVLSHWMPWTTLSQLTSADATAIAAYLKSIPAVKHEIPGPFGPDEKPTVPVLTIIPPDAYASLPKAPPPPK
jgi:mono/diheme cytochrome c family protein